VKELTSANLDKVGKKEKKLYVIKFSSPSCGPCNTMKPVIEELSKNNKDLSVYEVDTQKSPELAQHFEVRGVPTIKFCKKREILYSFTGVTPLGDLQYVIDNIDDPYFVEHGEFNRPKKKAPIGIIITFAIIVLGYIILTVFSNSYGAVLSRDVALEVKHSIKKVTVFSNKTLVERVSRIDNGKKKVVG
jgi:thiol-disulfide isomerase/thioredoxin